MVRRGAAVSGCGGRRLFRPGPRRPWKVSRFLFTGGSVLLVLYILTGIRGVLYPLSHPVPGVVCDRVRQVCATADGLSVPATTRWLGEVAGDQLSRYRGRGGDLRHWQFSNGVTCDAALSRCWQSPGQQTVLSDLSGELFLTARGPDTLPGPDKPEEVPGITNTKEGT